MQAAAIQMKAALGEVEKNMKTARALAAAAFKRGAELVLLPEFFTSAVGFNRKLLDAARPLDAEPMAMLKELAAEHGGIIGGSFIAVKNGQSCNTFVLAFPDGKTFLHDKDQPTMWENCYYAAGRDDGVLETPAGNIGAALCWEFVRSRTARRMKGRVDAVVGGSCWWTLPEKRFPGFPPRIHDRNLAIMKETIPRFARMLGVPVVHAAHAGEFSCAMPLVPGFPFNSHYLGETQIVDGTGQVLARMAYEDGEGFILADITLAKKQTPSEAIPDGFWIPELPWQLRFMWWMQNLHGNYYYRLVTKRAIRRRWPSH